MNAALLKISPEVAHEKLSPNKLLEWAAVQIDSLQEENKKLQEKLEKPKGRSLDELVSLLPVADIAEEIGSGPLATRNWLKSIGLEPKQVAGNWVVRKQTYLDKLKELERRKG